MLQLDIYIVKQRSDFFSLEIIIFFLMHVYFKLLKDHPKLLVSKKLLSYNCETVESRMS